MKKLCVAATMVVVITGFASTALAGEGNYIHQKLSQDAEKHVVATTKNEQVNELPCCQEVSKEENSTKP